MRFTKNFETRKCLPTVEAERNSDDLVKAIYILEPYVGIARALNSFIHKIPTPYIFTTLSSPNLNKD